ncbi:iron chaperone [Halobacillus sp. MO56]
MEVFAPFLEDIDNPEHRARTEEVLGWVSEKFPDLEPAIKWNQPMFTDHGTFIIAFSIAKKHLAVAPENKGIVHFSDDIKKAGYDHTKQLMRIPWDSPVDYTLLERMISFNIEDKADYTAFWRK